MRTEIHERTVTLSKICSVTDGLYAISVTIDKYYAWKNRKELIQDVFPELTKEEREFMISGKTPEEWNALFGEPDFEWISEVNRGR